MRTRSVVPAGPRTHSTDLSAIRTRHFGQMGASFSTDANTENPRTAVRSADFAASIISKSNQIRVIKEISSEPVAKRVARQEFPDSAAFAHSTVENSLTPHRNGARMRSCALASTTSCGRYAVFSASRSRRAHSYLPANAQDRSRRPALPECWTGQGPRPSSGSSRIRICCGMRAGLPSNKGHDTRALQAYLGHKNIQHTVRYTELAPTRFKDFWRD